ncbi:MAG: hypothetical protein LRY71_07940 [Bacillaceae bacterium]|nr:hypothetical protein [Bacillaceae bacterium]
MLQLCFFCGKLFAEENREFILIVVPDFSFQEVKWVLEHSNESGVWSSGGMIGMNIRPDGPLSYLNNMVTMSMGIRGVGVENWNAYQRGEGLNGVAVEDYYQQLTGQRVVDNILHPNFKKLVNKNSRTTFRGQVGILGDTLSNAGVDLFFMGNSDTITEKVRYGSLFTVNQAGFSKGEITDGTIRIDSEPNGLLMNVDKILFKLNERRQTTSGDTFTVIEWGDLYRLFQLKGEMDLQHFERKYKEYLDRLERFIYHLLQQNNQATVMLVSPMVNKEAYANKELLAPLFYWGPRALHSSYELISPTTRQQYVGSNLDIVPTIFDYFHLEQPHVLYGSPLVKKEVDAPYYKQVLSKMDLIVTVYRTRSFILSTYISLLVLLLGTVSALIFFKKIISLGFFGCKS